MENPNVCNRVKMDFSIPVGRAYLYMLVIAVPLTGFLALTFVAVRGFDSLVNSVDRFTDWTSVIPSLVIGVPLHELIHGLSWATFGKKPLKDIKFGFQMKTIAPYAHVPVPMKARAYRIGTVMPALVLGLLPYIVGLATGQGWFAAFGLLFVLAAGGDLLILWLIRKVEGEALVEDHPSRAGCYVYMARIGQ